MVEFQGNHKRLEIHCITSIQLRGKGERNRVNDWNFNQRKEKGKQHKKKKFRVNKQHKTYSKNISIIALNVYWLYVQV